MDPRATAGRIVHYITPDGQGPIAAIVNRDTRGDGTAELTIYLRTGPDVRTPVKYSERYSPGCWSWMPYQRQKAASEHGNQSESVEPNPERERLEAEVAGQRAVDREATLANVTPQGQQPLPGVEALPPIDHGAQGVGPDPRVGN